MAEDYDTSIDEAFGVNDGQVTIFLLILILSSYFYNKVIVIQGTMIRATTLTPLYVMVFSLPSNY